MYPKFAKGELWLPLEGATDDFPKDIELETMAYHVPHPTIPNIGTIVIYFNLTSYIKKVADDP